jgi:hypothetical protein
MRLVAFQMGDGTQRAGALIDGDTRINDLAEARAVRFRKPGPADLSVGGGASLNCCGLR